jgi:hypothetical protein
LTLSENSFTDITDKKIRNTITMKKIAVVFIIGLAMLLGFSGGWLFAKGPAALVQLTTKDTGRKAQWEQLASVKNFDQLYDSIGSIRDMVVAESQTEQEVIQGMRWILRDIAMVTEITADTNVTRPRFVRMDSDERKIAGDNPHGEYGLATIDGRYDYRITGNKGEITYFSINVNAGRGMSDRRMAAFLNDQTVEFDEDGNFTLLLSKTRPTEPGQWVPIPEDASSIMVRQYFLDRDEQLASFDIEVLGDDPGVSLPSDREMAERLAASNYAFVFLATLHKTVVTRALDQPNTFVETDSDELGGSISGPDNLYMIGHWAIADDEALVIDITPPETRYWNLAIETIWHESVDYLYRPTSLSKSDVSYRADGSVRFVIAKENPGVDNWLDAQGVNRGFMTFRWLDARDQAIASPQLNVVKLSALEKN